jgi:para-aminobenzoate synthetase component 1
MERLDSFLSRIGGLSGVHTQSISLQEDFLDLAARFAHLPGTVVLLSGGGLDCARYHLLGALPWLSMNARNQAAEVTIDDQTLRVPADPLRVLRKILNHFHLPATDLPLPPPLAAGLMGYLAYDLKDGLEVLARTSVDDLHLPAMLLYAPSVLVVHDTHRQTTCLLVPQRGPDAPEAQAVIRRFEALRRAPAPPAGFSGVGQQELRSNFTSADYQAAVQRVIDYIAAGDVYQVNLSQRFSVPFGGDAFALFRHLFAENPAPFFAFVQGGDHQIVSTSPERFLLQTGDRVESRPIKGTRPRGRTPDEDQAQREALTASNKDDAELSMIVDLLRNDIGKVSAPGTVRVAEHKRLEAYRNVYHLVSVVTGELAPGKDTVDLIAAAFPGGSITGCPKVRAMEIIDELEDCRRHVYCGSIGYIGFHRAMDLSIAIRTATIVGDTLYFSVGGGIVYDSKPLEEYEETLHKGRTLMAACQAGAAAALPAVVWHNGRLRPSRSATVPVTDQGLLYGHGFFETLRVDKGRAPLFDDHLARFDRTWQALMPDPVPDLTWPAVIAQVIQANNLQEGPAAVKILATRGSRMQAPWDHTLLVTARAYVHRLKTVTGEGLRLGTYPHPRQSPLAAFKTLNYLYYYQAGQWAHAAGHDEALVLNPDGSVSETHTAGLLLVNGRQVVRPQSPAALPGVMAAAVCRRLAAWGYDIAERPVRPAALWSAQQVLAANALMGAVPVVAIDGQARPGGNDLWVRLNDALIPEWRS